MAKKDILQMSAATSNEAKDKDEQKWNNFFLMEQKWNNQVIS